MHLDSSRFPGKLHALPACSNDEIILDEQVLHEQSGDPTHACIFDCISTDDGIPDNLPLTDGMMPAFISAVDTGCVRPIDGAVFDNPVMSPITGKGAALWDGSAGRRVRQREPLDMDVG